MSEKKSLSKNVLIRIIVCAVFVIAAVIAVVFAVKSKLSASTMRLLKYDGKVVLTGASGNELEAEEGRRLVNGNILKTKKESMAWVLLDEDRVVTLMEKSTAFFTQSGKTLHVSLEEGRLFFNIDRSLDANENLNISTSTMIIGIRGTSGYIDSDENGNSVLYLTTGEVDVVGLDDKGMSSDADSVKCAQKVTVVSGEETELVIEDVTESDLPFELINYLLSDEDLLEKVLEETGWDEEALEMSLASEDDTDSDVDSDAVSDVTNSGNTFDINELAGVWYGDGAMFISMYGDGTGTLYYPSDGMFGSDEGSLVPITMTYELSQDYMVVTDPVHYDSGLMIKYFLHDGELVLYDTINNRMLVKEGSPDPGDSWVNNPDYVPAQIQLY